MIELKVTPTGLEKHPDCLGKVSHDGQSDNKSDNNVDESRLIQAFRQLANEQQRQLVELLEAIPNEYSTKDLHIQ